MAPKHASYDVVIVGGGIYGAAVSWWLTRTPGFHGRILVVERDPSYEFASTSHTNSCIRQQFTNPLNIRISQFGAEFIRNFSAFMDDAEAPRLALQSFGYLYLADRPETLAALKDAQEIQAAHGAGTRHLTRDEIAAAYPFYDLDGILGGNHNLRDEGYFDGGTMFDWFRHKGRANGVEYLHDEVVAMTRNGARVESVTLKSGATVAAGVVVNAAGPRAVLTSRMLGIEMPVEPRKRYTYIFDAAEPLDRDLPLTIDPSGVHMRSDGRYYMAGGHTDHDPAVDYTDFGADHALWEEKFWPVIAARVPQFEKIKLVNMWVGHYAYNTLDQNAIVGPHPEIPNFLFVNGFSGHGLQQSPAIGRGLAEWIAYGEYRSLDLADFGFERLNTGRPFVEKAVI
ncbi:FAD-binding oxidoreductase [Sulfitobacter sp. D35]|uniref:NAD(P)/FAD-dependent oxidoreductase n=1 Tax=Sulfitobacter sp. D35 TaxID=3083252 RepID=UPI00296E3001|nr:FAD-binding oxidoreductase [Sulfitobacter sp. D35]MDW4499541.1 FAD-binding oxidoreductase [Sulfitobacter sp. D35]